MSRIIFCVLVALLLLSVTFIGGVMFGQGSAEQCAAPLAGYQVAPPVMPEPKSEGLTLYDHPFPDFNRHFSGDRWSVVTL